MQTAPPVEYNAILIIPQTSNKLIALLTRKLTAPGELRKYASRICAMIETSEMRSEQFFSAYFFYFIRYVC